MSDDTRPNFEGHAERECGDHRTVGPHRAWCYDCCEWCYPEGACRGCELPGLRAENERLRKSLRELVTKWENIGDDFHGAGCHDTAIGYENAAGDVRRMFADLGLASLSETGGEGT